MVPVDLTLPTLQSFKHYVPVVSCQVARVGKLLVASIPCALVRPLPSVGHHVPRQVGALCEYLVAARKVTGMCLPDLQALHRVWIKNNLSEVPCEHTSTHQLCYVPTSHSVTDPNFKI